MVTTETENGNDFLRAEPLPFYKSIIKASAAALIRTEEEALIEVRTNKEPCYEHFLTASHLTVNNSHKDRCVHFSLLPFL